MSECCASGSCEVCQPHRHTDLLRDARRCMPPPPPPSLGAPVEIDGVLYSQKRIREIIHERHRMGLEIRDLETRLERADRHLRLRTSALIRLIARKGPRVPGETGIVTPTGGITPGGIPVCPECGRWGSNPAGLCVNDFHDASAERPRRRRTGRGLTYGRRGW